MTMFEQTQAAEGQPARVKTTATNPYLSGMASGAAISLIVAVLLAMIVFGQGNVSDASIGNALYVVAGILSSLGVVLFALWLHASAIAWKPPADR